MKSRKFIKLKAAFLLTVFTLNTLICFACSVGIDMGFNHDHHADQHKHTSHSHSGKHMHGSHSGATAHNQSDDITGNGHEYPGQKDNCCDEKSVGLQKLDKRSNHSFNPAIKVPVLVAFLSTFSAPERKAGLSPLLNKAFIPQYYPPPDKRIIIQSFQI